MSIKFIIISINIIITHELSRYIVQQADFKKSEKPLYIDLKYDFESNIESGLGRSDMALYDYRNRRAMMIEAKRVTEPEDMPKACDEAVKKINERQYAKSIPNGYKTILCYGVAFCEKDCLIKLLRKQPLIKKFQNQLQHIDCIADQ